MSKRPLFEAVIPKLVYAVLVGIYILSLVMLAILGAALGSPLPQWYYVLLSIYCVTMLFPWPFLLCEQARECWMSRILRRKVPQR